MLHKVARAYGKWPHEVMQLSVEEQNIAFLCVLTHDAHVASIMKDGGAFPVVDLARMV